MRDFDNGFSSIPGCPIGLAGCTGRQEPRLHQGMDHAQSFLGSSDSRAGWRTRLPS
jgi:hypothetical protein